MSWQQVLQRLTETSERIAAVQLGQSTTALSEQTTLLDATRPRRIATPHERALFVDEQGQVFHGDLSKTAVQSQLAHLQQHAPSKEEQDIHRIFEATSALVEICDMTEARELLDEMLQRHQEIQDAISRLEEEIRLREERQASSRRDSTTQIEATIKLEQEQIEILEQNLAACMEQASTIERQLEQRRRASRRLSTIQHTDKDTQPVATVEMIETMQAQIQQAQQALAALDAEEEALTQHVWTDDLDVPLASLRHLEALKLDLKRQKRTSQSNMELDAGQDIYACLDQLITLSEERHQQDVTHELARDIMDILIDTVATGKSTLHPSDISDPGPAISQESIVVALVLQTLRAHDGEMPFAKLKETVSKHTTEQRIDVQAAVRAVYTLVANALVDIDRSTRDNMVRLL